MAKARRLPRAFSEPSSCRLLELMSDVVDNGEENKMSLDAIAIVGYMSVAVLSYGHDATARVGVAVVEISEAGEGDDGCPQTSIQVDGANARYELL